jgi:uncharacterized membrane protein YkvA (DUF1232 family)
MSREQLGDDAISAREAVAGPEAGAPSPAESAGRERPEGGEAGADEEAPLGRFWEAIRRMPRYAQLIAGLASDPRVPKSAKAALALGGAYAVSPIDLVPGIIPVAGQLDDLYVVLRAIRRAVYTSPHEVATEHLQRSGVTIADLEGDLQTVADTARWLVVRGAKTGGRLARLGARRLRDVMRRG